MRRAIVSVLLLCSLLSPAEAAGSLLEPHMHIAAGGAGHPQVALTLDACEGAVDMRILQALIDNRIAATIFVTGRWLRNNAAAIKLLAAHSDLFEIEDHGAMHIPAIIGTQTAYGIAPAGTAEAVTAEVQGGALAVSAAFHVTAHWYRDATALYSPDALTLIEGLGYHIGGFSLNGDFGATSPAAAVAKRIGDAEDGDVIISHINQPDRPSGAGVVAGVLALKAKGFTFVRLGDVPEIAG